MDISQRDNHLPQNPTIYLPMIPGFAKHPNKPIKQSMTYHQNNCYCAQLFTMPPGILKRTKKHFGDITQGIFQCRFVYFLYAILLWFLKIHCIQQGKQVFRETLFYRTLEDGRDIGYGNTQKRENIPLAIVAHKKCCMKYQHKKTRLC